MATESGMRVSDAERDAAAAGLREHFASGRLSQDEFSERLTAAFAARTRGDLSALFADLPPGQAGAGAGPGTGPRGQYRGQAPGGSYQRGADGSWSAGPGHAVRPASAALLFLLPLLMLFGALSVFGLGIGAGRPLAIVMLVAALAVLRRLLRMVFGRGRRSGPRRCCRR